MDAMMDLSPNAAHKLWSKGGECNNLYLPKLKAIYLWLFYKEVTGRKSTIVKKVSDILKTIKPISIDNFKTYKSSLPRATIPMPDLTKRRDPDMDKGLGSLPRKLL